MEEALEKVVGPVLGAKLRQNVKGRVCRERALLSALNDAKGLNYLWLPRLTLDYHWISGLCSG